MLARVIGLRANATAMPVPSSTRSVVLRREEQREERVVGRLRRPDAVVALLLELTCGRCADAAQVTTEATVDPHAATLHRLDRVVKSRSGGQLCSRRKRSSSAASSSPEVSRELRVGDALVGLRLELADHRLVLGVLGDELVEAGAVGLGPLGEVGRRAGPGPPTRWPPAAGRGWPPGRAWRRRSAAPGPRGRGPGGRVSAARRSIIPCTPEGTSTLERTRPAASSGARTRTRRGAAGGCGAPAPGRRRGRRTMRVPRSSGEVDDLLGERQPRVVGLVAEEQEHVVAGGVARPAELGLLPGQLRVDPVDEPHHRAAGPPVEQRVGVEAGDRAPVEVLEEDVGARRRRPRPASIQPSSTITTPATSSSGCSTIA